MVVAKAQLDYYPEEVLEKEIRKKNRETNRRKALKRRKRLNSLIKFACIFMAIFIMSISLFILRGYADISKVRMEINELQNLKYELEGRKFSLSSQLIEIKSSLKIGEDALYKLGMTHPRKDQIVYLSLDESAYDKNPEIAEDTGFTKKLNKMLSLFSSFF